MRSVWVAIIALGLAACGQPVRWQKVDGPYLIVAADDPLNRHLSYDLGDGNAIGRVDSTVTGVGHDDRYITVRREPKGRSGLVEYYYVVRALDGPGVPPEALKGPFDEAAYEREVKRLHLPDLAPVY